MEFASASQVGAVITATCHVCLGFTAKTVRKNALARHQNRATTLLVSVSVHRDELAMAANQYARQVAMVKTAKSTVLAMGKIKFAHQVKGFIKQ